MLFLCKTMAVKRFDQQWPPYMPWCSETFQWVIRINHECSPHPHTATSSLDESHQIRCLLSPASNSVPLVCMMQKEPGFAEADIFLNNPVTSCLPDIWFLSPMKMPFLFNPTFESILFSLPVIRLKMFVFCRLLKAKPSKWHSLRRYSVLQCQIHMHFEGLWPGCLFERVYWSASCFSSIDYTDVFFVFVLFALSICNGYGKYSWESGTFTDTVRYYAIQYQSLRHSFSHYNAQLLTNLCLAGRLIDFWTIVVLQACSSKR